MRFKGLSEVDDAGRWGRVRSGISSFFTIARFEPDTLALFAVLVGMTATLLLLDSVYLSLLVAGVFVAIFLVESFETIRLERAEYRQIVGARCLVTKRASATETGIARLLGADGRPEQEFWSIEASSPISEGETALVSGMRSVILLVAPMSEMKL